MKRGGVELPVVWAHCDVTWPQYDGMVTAMRARHKQAWRGDFELSERFNVAGTEVIIKIAGCTADWINGKSWENLVIRTYDETDHHECKTMLDGPDWTPPAAPAPE